MVFDRYLNVPEDETFMVYGGKRFYTLASHHWNRKAKSVDHSAMDSAARIGMGICDSGHGHGRMGICNSRPVEQWTWAFATAGLLICDSRPVEQ